jgi:hypothetical protein
LRYERRFQSLRGVPRGESEVAFESVVGTGTLDEFEEIVEVFVSACRK